jgi:hypothetical protein
MKRAALALFAMLAVAMPVVAGADDPKAAPLRQLKAQRPLTSVTAVNAVK